jgi:hypothetical protein
MNSFTIINLDVNRVKEELEIDFDRYDNDPAGVARIVADYFGWEEIPTKQDSLISFKRDGCRLNWYWSTRTLGSALVHPKKGATQLFRKRVNLHQLIKLLNYPRRHTGKGYYTK